MTCSPVSLYDSPEFQTAYLIVTVDVPSIPRWKINSSSETVNFNQVRPTPKTWVFSIDKCTGGIYHAGIPFIDIFLSQETASDYLRNLFVEQKEAVPTASKSNYSQGTFQSLGKHLIGSTIYEDPETLKSYLVILAVSQNEIAAELFNQPIYNITDISYTFIELRRHSPLSISPKSPASFTYCQTYDQFLKSGFPIRNGSLFKFDLRQMHFYSPTLDLDSPFPYPLNVISNGSFCWNKRFLIPFEANNCLPSCVIILQGRVYSLEKETNTTEMKNNIIYIAKRSSMYPGTRYNTRGLKITSSNTVEPANECECELIFTQTNSPYYYSQTWRRGSAPILWETQVEMKFNVKNVLKTQPTIKTSLYFNQHIIKRFGCHNLHVVSLLENDNPTERTFNQAYEEGLNELRDKWAEIPLTVTFQPFDLNRELKDKDGNFEDVAHRIYTQKIIHSDGTEVTFADDVERSHFTIVDSVTGQFQNSDSQLHLDDTTSTETFDLTPENSGYANLDNQSSNDLSSAASSEQNLPDGEEPKRKISFVDPLNERRQGTVFRFNCVDSLDRTNVGTFFYALLVVSKFAHDENVIDFIEDEKVDWKNPSKFLKKNIIDFLGAIFIESGNVISTLYAGTNAIKKRVIEHFTSSGTGPVIWNKFTDIFISLQRRYKNILTDPIRQDQIDDWTETHHITDPQFVIDPQHISFCSLFNDNTNELNHTVCQTNQKIFSLSSQSKEIIVMFPEPLILYGISVMTLSRNIDENMTMSISFPSKTRNRRIFFSGMPFPIISPTSNKDSESFVWVTYDLRKIDKYSNLFPNDSDCMKPTAFVSISFNSETDLTIGNIKFIVKRPKSMLSIRSKGSFNKSAKRYHKSNQYELIGSPPIPPGKDLAGIRSDIYNQYAASIPGDSLPTMDQLIPLMFQWIQAGFSDYNKFPIFIERNLNPWAFDLCSRMHSQSNKSICPFCNQNKTKWKEMLALLKQLKEENVGNNEILHQSTVYMENPEFPLFFIKTIKPDINPEHATFLCPDCSHKFDEMLKLNNPKRGHKTDLDLSKNEEEDISDPNDLGETSENDDDVTIENNIINQYHENFVNIGDASDYFDLILPALYNGEVSHLSGNAANLHEIARVYNHSSLISYTDLSNALHASSFSKSISPARIKGKQISFSVGFAAFVIPNSITLLLENVPEKPFSLSVYIPGSTQNILTNQPQVSSSNKQYIYTISTSNISTLQSMIFKFTTQTNEQDEIDISIKMLNINGIITPVPPKFKSIYINNASRAKQVSLPKFSLMNSTWNQPFRTQVFSPKSHSLFSIFSSPQFTSVKGIAIQMNPKFMYKDCPKCIVIGFYKNNNLDRNSMHTIILPTEISTVYSITKDNCVTSKAATVDCLYFPICPIENDFDSISVFYTDRSATAEPLRIMFF